MYVPNHVCKYAHAETHLHIDIPNDTKYTYTTTQNVGMHVAKDQDVVKTKTYRLVVRVAAILLWM